MSKIDAKYLTKVYKDGSYALKNCSLSVKAGEFLVVLGASGSGKSTLLKILAGVEPISSGELYIDGVLSDSIPPSKRDVSMVFQEYLLYPHMTVFDNLATPLKLLHEDEKSIYDRVMDTLRLFGLEYVADVKPRNLSGGEQQRVALAKTLLKRSRLVLLDEPMSNVDEKARWAYCKTLKEMKAMLPESTFVYVTHNSREALLLADRIAVMHDGVVLEASPKDFLLEHYEYRMSMEMLGREGYNDEIEFDENGRTLAPSSTELRLSGRLEDNILTFADQHVELNEQYMSRLLRRPTEVDVVLEVEVLSKTKLSDGISLVFEVEENGENYVLLKIENKKILLSRRTDLKPGEKIRLYYKIRDIILYEGDERLTCHYPLNRKIRIRILDSERRRIEILGRSVKLKNSVPRGAKFVHITDDAFRLSYDKGDLAIRVLDCLDEEFINQRKLSHLKIKGQGGYLSFMGKEEVTCFGREKVWLNILTEKLEFTTEE